MADVTTPEAAEAAETATDPLLAYAALIEEVSAPISADAPCGDDVRYDDAFQQLKTEIDRIGSVATDIDYERIVELGRTILTTKSKDLTTAGYLILGLVRTEEVAGMAEGIVILDTLVETFWEQVHPEKPVRRRNAIQYVADQLKTWLELRLAERRPTEEERAPLELSRDRLKAMQTFTMEALEEMAPALSGVLKALDDTIRRLPAPAKPEPKPAPATPAAAPDRAPSAAASPDAAPAAAVPTTFTSESDANVAFYKGAAFLREQDRTNPTPYRLLRVLRWGRVTQEPPNDGGKTRIPAPPAQRIAYLSGLLEKGAYDKLLEEGENDLQAGSIFLWLGLQRLVAAGAEALGRPYQGVAEAVMIETALLMRRLPGLVNLTYSDGTAFVDPMTREWLEMKVEPMLGAGEGGASGASTPSGGGSHIDEQYQAARAKLGTGDLAGALAAMQEGSGQDASEEDRFQRRLYVAVLCLRGNQPGMARAMLESLDQEAARYTLDAWKPSLMLEVWGNLYTCYVTLAKTSKPAPGASGKETFADLAAQMLDKISRLDAGYALRVLGQA